MVTPLIEKYHALFCIFIYLIDGVPCNRWSTIVLQIYELSYLVTPIALIFTLFLYWLLLKFIAFYRAVDLNVFAGKVRSASCRDEGICIRIMNGASSNQRLNLMLRSSTALLKEPC